MGVVVVVANEGEEVLVETAVVSGYVFLQQGMNIGDLDDNDLEIGGQDVRLVGVVG